MDHKLFVLGSNIKKSIFYLTLFGPYSDSFFGIDFPNTFLSMNIVVIEIGMPCRYSFLLFLESKTAMHFL